MMSFVGKDKNNTKKHLSKTMASMRVLKRIDDAHTDAIWCISWSNAFGIVTGSVDETVKLWKVQQVSDSAVDISSQFTVKNLLLGIVSVSSTLSHPIAALSSLDSQIRLWNMESKTVDIIECGPIDCWTLTFSPDGKRIAAGSYNGTVLVWDVASKELLFTLHTKEVFLLSIAWSPDGKYIACGGKDGSVFIFDVGASESSKKGLIATLQDHALPVRALCFSPKSDILFAGSDDASVSIYDIKGGNIIGTLRGHLSWILSVQVSPDGRMVATSSSDKTVKIWDISQEAIEASTVAASSLAAGSGIRGHTQSPGFGKVLHTFDKAHSDEVFGLAFSPDGKMLASVGGDGALQIYSVA